ncbi:unnamed protein product [Didymodactylos carnosus]|uniref:Uncharacterized protein n=1 Tax=Didymodactylos carnosus TaxID=1234261 RepID=A0A8S2KXF9_9BILA|nr:unnamed protein product [Didymodactylos carnosus]CAF3875064.1 unnamed protein product [Didymodactylos carnosus]
MAKRYRTELNSYSAMEDKNNNTLYQNRGEVSDLNEKQKEVESLPKNQLCSYDLESDKLQSRVIVKNEENVFPLTTPAANQSLGLCNDSMILTNIHPTYHNVTSINDHSSQTFRDIKPLFKHETIPLFDTCLPNEDVESTNSYNESLTSKILLVSVDISNVFYYAEHGQFDELHKVLQFHYKQAVQMKNVKGQTLLHIAVIQSFAYVWVRLLLMRGADPCAQDKDGYTSVHYAVEKDDLEMLKALTIRFHPKVKVSSEVEFDKIHENCTKSLTLTENFGMTAIMLACYKGAIKCITYLHEQQLIDNINRTDIFDDTSLHYAVAHNNKHLTEFLVNNCRADVNGGNTKRPSALDIAVFNQNTELKELLVSRDCKLRSPIKRQGEKRKTSDAELLNSGMKHLSIEPLECRTSPTLHKKMLPIDEQKINSLKKTALEQIEIKNYPNALKLRREEHDLLVKYYGHIHADVARSCHDLAFVYHSMDNYQKALINYNKSLYVVAQLSLSPREYPYIPNCYANIGLIHSIQNRFSEAIRNFNVALLIRQTFFPKQTIETERIQQIIQRAQTQIE